MTPGVPGRERTGTIVLEHVTQRFSLPREGRAFTALEDVSFDVGGGEFVSIVGPSGCGKSTLLALVAGLVPVSAGRITLDGEPVAGVNPRLGFVFSLITRDGVARVIETMRAFDAVPAGMKLEPESVYDNRFVLKPSGR
jgi:NitT/TauT family transport system ATP-binding protein